MFVSRMWLWVPLTMTLILCLTLTLTDVTEANQAKLVGTVYCDTCFHQHFSHSSYFISGALVAVECGGGDEIQASGGKRRFRKEVRTDVKGEFRVILPFSATKHANEIKGCAVKLISSSNPDCAEAAIATTTSSSIRLKKKTPQNHVFSAGFFTFQPLEQPKRCQWESHANSNDEVIASTPLPSPAVDGMLAPIPPLTGIELHDLADGNSFGSTDLGNQILPPPFRSQPPPDSMFIPEVPPPPDSMLNTGVQPPPPDFMLNPGFQPSPPADSMFNTGSQPSTPDSMFNEGFQSPPPDSMFNTDSQPPPPDSMFNTGSQPPPPDSMFDTGSQPPPPDSMFNPNPLRPPPDSIFDPSQPPPPSLTPSLPVPPVDPQPDLIQAAPPPPSMPPPQQSNPPFPAFPFQPSAGLPRMPPVTKKPPLLYK